MKTLTTKDPRPGEGLDLLRVPLVGSFLKSRYNPSIFQVLVLSIFAFIIYWALFGIDRGGKNPATLLIWTLWWPLLPVSLILMGRYWCAVCPIRTTVGMADKIVGQRGTMPGRWLRRYGVWIMIGTFLLLTWSDRIWHTTGSPQATGLIFLGILGAALITRFFYKRHTFCRFMCPIGALTGLYSTTAVVEVRADPERCLQCRTLDCYRGNERVEGCPLFEFPRTMESNRNCNLCGNCIKSCPHDAIEVRLRPPAREIPLLKRPATGEAFLALAMVAVVYIQTVDMTPAWRDYMKWIVENTLLQDYNIIFTLTFIGIVALVLVAFLMASQVSSDLSNRKLSTTFAIFGFAYLPLALAGHVGHNVNHLFGEGPLAVRTIVQQIGRSAGLQATSAPEAFQLAGAEPLAFSILGLGIIGSLYLVWRVSKGRNGARAVAAMSPHLLLLVALSLAFVQLFLMPMNPLHTH